MQSIAVDSTMFSMEMHKSTPAAGRNDGKWSGHNCSQNSCHGACATQTLEAENRHTLATEQCKLHSSHLQKMSIHQ